MKTSGGGGRRDGGSSLDLQTSVELFTLFPV